MSFEQSENVRMNADGGALRIRAAAALALRELDLLRSSGPATQKTFEAEVERIAQEKLRPHGCDLFVHRIDGGTAGVAIKIQGAGIAHDLIKNFFHRDNGSVLEKKNMKLGLKSQKLMVTGGLLDVARTIAEAVAAGQVDVVIWIRDWDESVNEAQPAAKVELPTASHKPNGTSPQGSLWRQTMGYRT